MYKLPKKVYLSLLGITCVSLLLASCLSNIELEDEVKAEEHKLLSRPQSRSADTQANTPNKIKYEFTKKAMVALLNTLTESGRKLEMNQSTAEHSEALKAAIERNLQLLDCLADR